jgi:RNA polymerase sigma factor (sigma-70 family)
MAVEGGEGALERLVRENLGWLRGWLRGRVRDPELADDLCQEAFLRALRRYGGLRDPERIRAWLYRIAVNTLRDHLRSEHRRRGKVVFTDQIEELETPTEAEDALGRDESAERLLAAIRALPARLREPLLLRHSQNLSYREIAKILGISENAVQVRIFRARQLLRAQKERLRS